MKTRNKLIAAILILTAAFQNANAQSWSTTGNTGTNGATNFIGTTDNVSFKIRTNNALRVTVTNNGKFGIGNFSPVFKLDVKGGSINTDSLYRINGVQVLKRDATNHIQIGDATAKVTIGVASSSYSLHVAGNTERAGNFVNTASSQNYYGVWGSCYNTPSYGIGVKGQGGYMGVAAEAILPGAGDRVGASGLGADGTGSNYGLQGVGTGGNTAYGVFGSASGANTNWAGYFDNGNVYINHKAGIGILTPLYALDVRGDSLIAGNFVNTSSSVDNFGVYGRCNNTPSYGYGVKGEGGYLGVEGEAKMVGSGSRLGVRGKASGGSATNWGIAGLATGGNIAYAVYGNASGAVTNWAGYFENGNVYIQNNTGIGNINPVYPLDVTSSGFRTANFINTATGTNSFGVYSSCNNTPNLGYGVYGEGGYKGVLASASLAGTGNRFGVDATGANGTLDNYGVRGTATGGLITYGIYGTASGASSANFAGYFDNGDVLIKNRLRIGFNSVPAYSLDIISPDYTAAYIKSGVNAGTTMVVDANALTGNVWAISALAPVSGYAGHFAGNVYCTGSYLPSDEKLKENIQPLENALDKVLKLDVKTYLFKQGFENMNLPVEKQYGYIAQNLESVFPELVKLNPVKEGQPLEFKAVNYIGMIPVLTAAIQEQQTKMDAKDNAMESKIIKLENENAGLQSRLDQLEAALSQCCMNYKSGSGTSVSGGNDQARLEQNIPNPFSENTIIKYYIPSYGSKSIIKIYSAEGAEIKSIPVSTNGFGQTEISGSTLPAGIYTYLLLMDGKVVDTKQMILTR